jgi:hypothetical protein
VTELYLTKMNNPTLVRYGTSLPTVTVLENELLHRLEQYTESDEEFVEVFSSPDQLSWL